MQVEIPYVPAAQRSTKRVEVVEQDTIVTVGQARQKRKRKAGEGKEQAGSGVLEDGAFSDSKPNAKKTPVGAVEPFDFAAVPNILDDNPDMEDRKKKRQRKQNKGKWFFFLAL
jgi:exosome complex exonuclease RRP6